MSSTTINILGASSMSYPVIQERLDFLSNRFPKDIGIPLVDIFQETDLASLPPLIILDLVSEMWMSYPTNSW